MLVIDEYHKSWALRYLREAKSDLKTAKEAPYTEPNPLLESLKKGQLALYYILGEPQLIHGIVHMAMFEEGRDKDPLLHFLVDVEKTLGEITSGTFKDREQLIKYAEEMLSILSEVINLFLTKENHKSRG